MWFFFFLLSGNGWWWDPIFLAIVIIIIRRDVDVENGTDRSRRSWEFIQTGSIFLGGFLISKSRVITSAKRTGGEIPFSCTFGRAYRQLFFYKKPHLFSKLFFHSRQSCGDSSPPAFSYSFITFLCPVIDLYFSFLSFCCCCCSRSTCLCAVWPCCSGIITSWKQIAPTYHAQTHSSFF